MRLGIFCNPADSAVMFLIFILPCDLSPSEATWLARPLWVFDELIQQTIPLPRTRGLAHTLNGIRWHRFGVSRPPVISTTGLGSATISICRTSIILSPIWIAWPLVVSKGLGHVGQHTLGISEGLGDSCQLLVRHSVVEVRNAILDRC